MTQTDLEQIHANIGKLMDETMRISAKSYKVSILAVVAVLVAALVALIAIC